MHLKKKLSSLLTSLPLAFGMHPNALTPTQGAEADKEPLRYAIVAKKETLNDAEWKKAVVALEKKYTPFTKTFAFTNTLEETRTSLSAYAPTHVAYVAKPEELVLNELTHNPFKDLEVAGSRGSGLFTRLLLQLDNDPYPDALSGIITGATAADALRLAEAKPFTINHALLKTLGEEENQAAFPNVTYFSDGRSENRKVVKKEKRGKVIEKKLIDVAGPDVLKTLNTGPIDAVVVSCHASYRDWDMGWRGREELRYDDLWEVGKDATIVATASDKTISGTVHSPRPKIYWGAGNCEGARIVQGKNGIESMALAWMHSAGVVQHIGYTLDTWHGFVGWNLRHALLSSEKPTLSEAYTQTLTATIHEAIRLAQHREKHNLPFITQNWQRFTENHELGKYYDVAAATFYGDPALDIRVGKENTVPLFEKSLTVRAEGSATNYICSLKIVRENTEIQVPVVYFLPVSDKYLRVRSASPGLNYTLLDDRVIFETSRIKFAQSPYFSSWVSKLNS